MKLGCNLPIKTTRRGGYFLRMDQDGVISATLDLGAYFDPQAAAPVLPSSTNWLDKATDAIKRMYLNDQESDCVIASLAHLVGVWTGNASALVQATDAEIQAIYRIWNPRGDNGCNIATVNNYWRDHGAMLGGKLHKIDAYVSIDNTNKDLVKAALALFANIKLGIDLPASWHDNGGDGSVWDVTNSRVVGGHDVPAIDFADDGVKIATWGGTRRMTWAAFTSKNYIKESYSALSPDWYANAQTAPNGIDAAALKADLDAVANGQIPSVGPVDVPNDWLI